MKLLIVDDEELTREGIIKSIDWNLLGINDIYQADDGIRGLSLAKKHRPEIILSDVRMPRMDGIEMAFKIKDLYPDITIIFMSGYSDKEYLKAAIKLKAVSYIEKPIIPDEIKASIVEAISNHEIFQRTKDSFERQIKESKSDLTLELIYSNKNEYNYYIDKFKKLNYTINPSTMFSTMIIKFVDGISSFQNLTITAFYDFVNKWISSYHLQSIHAVKQDDYLIYHIFYNDMLTIHTLRQISIQISDFLGKHCDHYIGLGKIVTGANNIYESYNSSVILLQSSFFFDYNEILFFEKSPTEEDSLYTEPISDDLFLKFSEGLLANTKKDVFSIIDFLYLSLKEKKNILENYAKDIYYKLFTEIFGAAASLRLNLTDTGDDPIAILDYIAKGQTLTSLNQSLLEKTEIFFDSVENSSQENSTIFLIKDFISKNYKNEKLSIKDISDHVFLSTSYVCTVFKNETGSTLNQYLTDYRIEKAKRLLLDSRYKISEISTKVGYSDGNYFGKSFKKSIGLSPSEFREKNTK